MFDDDIQLDAAAFQALPEAVLRLDVRQPWEHELARIPGSVLIPLNVLEARVGELDRTRPVAIYCHHGARSMQALRFLQSLGFLEVANLRGGINAYSRLDPSVPTY